MSNKTDRAKAKAESIQELKKLLATCGPEGKGSLTITWVSGTPSPTGRTDRFELVVWGIDSGRPTPMFNITSHVARALGYRLNDSTFLLSMSGYGFDKKDEIASSLTHLVGHPIYLSGTTRPHPVPSHARYKDNS